jgi:hypothetical protein
MCEQVHCCGASSRSCFSTPQASSFTLSPWNTSCSPSKIVHLLPNHVEQTHDEWRPCSLLLKFLHGSSCQKQRRQVHTTGCIQWLIDVAWLGRYGVKAYDHHYTVPLLQVTYVGLLTPHLTSLFSFWADHVYDILNPWWDCSSDPRIAGPDSIVPIGSSSQRFKNMLPTGLTN